MKDLSIYRVNLNLRSQQQAGDETPEVIEQNLDAWLRSVPGGIILYYEESEDDSSETTQAELHITADEVILKRTGAQAMEMHFKLNKAHDLVYDTPYGRFPLKINTRHMDMTELDHPEGSCSLRYELSFEGQPMLNHHLDVAWLRPEASKGDSHD